MFKIEVIYMLLGKCPYCDGEIEEKKDVKKKLNCMLVGKRYGQLKMGDF